MGKNGFAILVAAVLLIWGLSALMPSANRVARNQRSSGEAKGFVRTVFTIVVVMVIGFIIVSVAKEKSSHKDQPSPSQTHHSQNH